MSTTKTTVALSESELALINLAREKAELKKKEDLLIKEQKRQKDIDGAKAKIQKELDNNKKYVDAVLFRFEEFERLFPGEFKLVQVADEVKTEECYDYEWDAEGKDYVKDKRGNSKKDIYFSEKFKLKKFEIRYKDFKEPCILVKEHLVDKGYSRYDWKSFGFKMVTKGVDFYKEDKKYYTNLATIRQRIIDKIERDDYEKKQERIHKAGMPWVIKAVKEKYGKELKEVEEYCGNVQAEFKNGLTVTFHYDYNEEKEQKYELIIMKIEHGYYLKNEEIVEALMTLKKHRGE